MDVSALTIALIGALPADLSSYVILAVLTLAAISGAVAQLAALFNWTTVLAVDSPIYAFLQKLAGNYGHATNADSASAPKAAGGPPPSKVAILLVLILPSVLGLSACTPAEQQALQAACQVDAASQPIMVALAPLFGPDGAALAAADVSIAHPLVVAACAAVGGKPVAVTPAS